MRSIIAMALVLAAGVANAAPVPLLCKGTAERKTLFPAKFPDSVSMVVDIAANTLTLDNDGALPDDVFPIESVSDSNVTVHFPDILGDTVSISLNRLSGHVSMTTYDKKGQLAWTFSGTCKPAQKLF